MRVSAVLRKVFVTLLTGGVAYLITNLSNASQISVMTLSVFVGGVTLVVQFLAEFENRLQLVETAQVARFESVEQLVRDNFSKINEATELFGLVERSALRTELVTELVRQSARLDPDSAVLVYDFAQSEIARVSRMIKELSDGGDITYEGEDRDWLLELTRNAKHSIDATSLTTVDAGGRRFDDGLWLTDLGQRYLEAQREAIGRGVTVRRIFVLDRPDRAEDPDLVSVCKFQQQLGIQVRVLYPAAAVGTWRASMFDFILFDNVISYESTPASWVEEGMRPTIVHTRLVLRDSRVAARIQRYKDLWASASEVF
jgi:hypothetical protein